MTEEQNEETQKSPYDFRDPSEMVREIVSGDDEKSPESDPGDESDHEEKEQDQTVEEPKSNVEEPSVGMKSLNDYLDEDLAGVVSSLVKKIDRLESEKRNASTAAKVDDLVNSLGDEWQPVFRDKENRAKLNTAIQVIKTGYERSNVPVPDEQEIVEKALRAEFGGVKETIEQEATQAKVSARKSQMISRASGRRTDSLSPKESALRAVHKIMTERGIYNS
jgi:hypothetical protein|tara:strand:- start:75 stop:737 length:663 start_codon:yes stop_codon:yes gene_type:complete